MALARSASGPGGLSINTNSANSLFGSGTTPATTGGMFGNATKPADGGGLFGAATTSAPATGGLFGSSTTAAAPASGGLFGSNSASAAPATGGLFGSTPAAPASASAAPATGGLFGSNTTTATSQPSTSLFGSATATAQPAAGGLFGSSTATPKPAGGLFGSSTATPQPQAGGLFGSAQTQQPQAQQPQTSSLFGSTQPAQQQQQPQSNSLFGQTNQGQQQGGNMFGNTLGSHNQNQSVPGVRIDISNIRTTTKFNDLHEDLQKEIANMDSKIQSQIQLKNECDAIMPAHFKQLERIAPDVDFCKRKMTGVEDALESDAEAISSVRGLIKIDAEAAKLSFRVIDNLKLPAQYHNTGIWSGKSGNPDSRGQSNGEDGAQDLVGFFSNTADELKARLEKFERNLTEIELHLRGVEANSAQQLSAMIAKKNGASASDENPIQELADTLTVFEQSILGVAGKVGETRVGVQTLQRGDFLNGSTMKANGKRGGVY